jgi:hypothetical protein
MTDNPFVPQYLIGRQSELQQVSQILSQDSDLLLAGVPGIGRHTLIRAAAGKVGARVLEIDCLRAINASRFLELLAEGLLEVFSTPTELALVKRWCMDKPLILEHSLTPRARLVWHCGLNEEWKLFQILLSLPQVMAEWLDCRVVLVFQNFPHIRSWDRSRKWETYLEQEIQRQSRVSYALIATVPEDWISDLNLQVITLGPLAPEELQPWIVSQMASQGFVFDEESLALKLFHNYVQGHFGGAIALARRIWLDSLAFGRKKSQGEFKPKFPPSIDSLSLVHPNKEDVIQAHHVHRSALALVEDQSMTFESLILLLPPSQVRVLESLALDPTDSPHSREYIKKHQLSRGGGLQGALAGLEQKGLVYGPKYGYRIAIPLLAFWLKHRLS